MVSVWMVALFVWRVQFWVLKWLLMVDLKFLVKKLFCGVCIVVVLRRYIVSSGFSKCLSGCVWWGIYLFARLLVYGLACCENGSSNF